MENPADDPRDFQAADAAVDDDPFGPGDFLRTCCGSYYVSVL